VGAIHRTFGGLFEIAAIYIDDIAEETIPGVERSKATVAELRELTLDRIEQGLQHLSRQPAQYPPIFWRPTMKE
jgi:precorrin-4 methylase